jgi:hypothetical protein
MLKALFLVRRFLSLWWWRRYDPTKDQFFQQPHGATSQKTAFFIVTAVITSNLLCPKVCHQASPPLRHMPYYFFEWQRKLRSIQTLAFLKRRGSRFALLTKYAPTFQLFRPQYTCTFMAFSEIGLEFVVSDLIGPNINKNDSENR